MGARHFTLEEANRTLPLVRRIVQDITAEYPAWRELVQKYELAAAGARAEEGEAVEQRRLRLEVEQVARRVNAYLEELAQIGCLFKGFEEGLVDFRGRLEGREVFWCWKLGEPHVEHWHELDAGFAGRRRVPERIGR